MKWTKNSIYNPDFEAHIRKMQCSHFLIQKLTCPVSLSQKYPRSSGHLYREERQAERHIPLSKHKNNLRGTPLNNWVSKTNTPETVATGLETQAWNQGHAVYDSCPHP
ncbi:hypothetical protein H1C71_038372 [Ictidomys tridecemlineatus]|nr:hypothetical protein H1C71_038372 [Ictidomys tridecemlineatus]